MNNNDLEKMSKEELVGIIKSQRYEIKKIFQALEYIYENKHKQAYYEDYDELNYKLDEIANILES